MELHIMKTSQFVDVCTILVTGQLLCNLHEPT